MWSLLNQRAAMILQRGVQSVCVPCYYRSVETKASEGARRLFVSRQIRLLQLNMPRLAASTPEVVLPPPLPPSATVLALRSNVKLAYISQFVSLFKSHVNLTFAIEVSCSTFTPTVCTQSAPPSKLYGSKSRAATDALPPFPFLGARRSSAASRSFQDPTLTSIIVSTYRTSKQTSTGVDQAAACPCCSASSVTRWPTTATRMPPTG